MACDLDSYPALKAIYEKNILHGPTRRFYEFVEENEHRVFSQKVREAASQVLPSIYVPTNFLDSCNFVANTTCKYFNGPLEVSGIVRGKKSKTRMVLKQFHTYFNQTCTPVLTQVSGFGNMQTAHKSKKYGDVYCCDAHSHNTMQVFHSNTDYTLLTNHVQNGSHATNVTVNGVIVRIPYAVNVVFNNETSEHKPPHILGCMQIPQYSARGQRTIETLFEQPDVRIVQSDELSNKEKRRLYKEISTRITKGNNYSESIR